jgi:DNA-binding response OmpR family regulator
MDFRPTILVIDDDAALTATLTRFVERGFPDYQVLWAGDGLDGLLLVRQHIDNLRLVILDVDMPRMDGNLAAAQIRSLAPSVPVMPFTAHEESLPALCEMGCVMPTLKHPGVFREMPARIRTAMNTSVTPAPDLPWIAAMRQSACLLLAHNSAGMVNDDATAEQLSRALDCLKRYSSRFSTPAREVTQAQKLLREAGIR